MLAFHFISITSLFIPSTGFYFSPPLGIHKNAFGIRLQLCISPLCMKERGQLWLFKMAFRL